MEQEEVEVVVEQVVEEEEEGSRERGMRKGYLLRRSVQRSKRPSRWREEREEGLRLATHRAVALSALMMEERSFYNTEKTMRLDRRKKEVEDGGEHKRKMTRGGT